mgnify:CR=1 FL=1
MRNITLKNSRSLLLASSNRAGMTPSRPPTTGASVTTITDPPRVRGFKGRTMNPDELEELGQDTVEKLNSLRTKK